MKRVLIIHTGNGKEWKKNRKRRDWVKKGMTTMYIGKRLDEKSANYYVHRKKKRVRKKAPMTTYVERRREWVKKKQ